MSINPYKAQQTYKTTSIQTASQGRLVVMLFEGAIRFMNTFIEASAAGQVERAHENAMKAQRIMTELMLALDHEKGGDVSRAIERAYEDIRRRMTLANIRKDAEIARTVIRDLDSFRETWTTVFRQVEVETPAASVQGVSIRT